MKKLILILALLLALSGCGQKTSPAVPDVPPASPETAAPETAAPAAPAEDRNPTAAEDDFRLIEDKQGGLGGTDEHDQEVMEVRFYPSGSQMYAVLYEYPMEAAESFGARLAQIAETFEVME